MAKVFAAADIGSNTLHLLVSEASGKGLRRMVNESEWLSLGEIVSREGVIPELLIERLVEILKGFKRTAEAAKAESFYVFATEAMRRADNCASVLKRVKAAVGIEIELISPQREAELGLRGALMDTHPLSPHLMVETGGGSVQAACCRGHDILQESSLPIGTGVLIAAAQAVYPVRPSQVERMRLMIAEALEGQVDDAMNVRSMIACGGVARGIWRAMHPDGARMIHVEELKFLAWDVTRLDLPSIALRYGVKAKRAGTLLPGALIYEAFLHRFSLEEFEVSQFGVREGAILEMAARKV